MKITFENKEDREAFKSAITCNCDKCGMLTEYSKKYDAYFCPDCDLWAEGKCEDENCEYCAERPETPSLGT